MSHNIADTSLGLSAQALAVLAMLAQMSCDGLAEFDRELMDYKIEIKTHAWYNGRERGVCLEVRPCIASDTCLLVTFGEHRNSDDIFVDAWEHKGRFLNPPTVADFTDEAYASRTIVQYGNVARAVDVIRDKIRDFMERSKTPTLTMNIHGNSIDLPVRVLPDLGDGEVEPSPRAEYRLAEKGTSPGGTSFRAEVAASYNALRTLLGTPQYLLTRPDRNSDGKVSTEWILTNAAGEVFTIYDYKETNLYDEDAPSPMEFRKLPSYNWHIGAVSKEGGERFASWLRARLNGGRS